ncbi:heptaprenyl diphosphate synthase component 1 [Sporolactobacillus kofuensis]|uniref:Heptaprenyl diphosphate synthase component 1 n=1 Tax=Sporolactobacillus kofuensis TaxID=269672 RepID=A0ABW1WED2_9BACL|nr:heptaprenyl diphosphate synthase component 1 [Sporolactobacillus kofuensis]MCO7176755.1 heptaprenyl diphosphate synthase component 1 [Sporolactobacillus kofuensis]
MSIYEEAELVYHQLLHEMNHPYVQKNMPKPTIDRDKLMIYYLMFRHSETTAMARTCAISVMLAEIGLNTHETMTVSPIRDKDVVKKRQLTVLSGDFYSALYYYTLVRHSKREVVKWVAEAIQNFNVQKSRFFYGKASLNWAQKIDSIRIIESALVSKIATQLGYAHFIPILSNFFLIKRLLVEKRKQENADRTSGYLLTESGEEKATLIKKLETEIKTKGDQFVDTVNTLENPTVLLSQITEFLHRRERKIIEGC